MYVDKISVKPFLHCSIPTKFRNFSGTRACDFNVCINGGTCNQRAGAGNEADYTCTCLPAYTGNNCELVAITCSPVSIVYGTNSVPLTVPGTNTGKTQTGVSFACAQLPLLTWQYKASVSELSCFGLNTVPSRYNRYWFTCIDIRCSAIFRLTLITV